VSSERAFRKSTFDLPQRVHLLEVDADENDERHDDLMAKLGRMQGIMLGILVSTTTAALLLAANLIAGGG
jgi:hypothetical protein